MKRILLLLPEGFEFLEASVFIDVFGWNLVDGDGTTKLFTCGMTKEVTSAFDQKLIVDYLIEEINMDDFDALAIPGGFEQCGYYIDSFKEPILNLIREFHSKDKWIASVCVAAIVLGRSGILKGKKATTYNMNPERQAMLSKFDVNVVQEPIVVDGKIITSWNPSTAMDVALTLLEFLTSLQNAAYIREIMGFKKI
ncbi:Deglycase PfpI [Candidatus Lokiarchaeum ossiferum]|uniref:Deglycase PfpI n=1 Tax=Candidatus Lokiarchaeum ossiferum TaxID=2951803 RepID=A0ABY6HWU8_9ARCH|nr:Deglycase PfpI [Candidatus Lokiarchaeum sp. B-35]